MTRQIFSIITAVAVAAVTVALFIWAAGESRGAEDQPWKMVQTPPPKTSHEFLFKRVEKFSSGPEVTRACLKCHPQAAAEVMKTSHWNWMGEPEMVPGHDQPVRIGKANLINNFCISIESNWPKCTTCHAGYGWSDAGFDFTNAQNVDCLVCHDQTGQYVKGQSGEPTPDVDLLASAKSVGRPTRDNCGYCHFNGGGGNAVKHGDIDGSLANPVDSLDVHMGRNDFQCLDCHRTRNHRISGKMISVSVNDTLTVNCTDCHAAEPHRSQRLNDHTLSLACQSCHIPALARKEATKMLWDWSTAGQDVPVDNPHRYLKIKGSFVYARNVPPEYYWFNGSTYRYLKGDIINPETITHINYPIGDISDPKAKIYPFKVHRAKQPYDLRYKYLIVPKTVGEDGYWNTFNWDQAFRLGAIQTDLPYSGEYGFTETDMYWVISHMVAPARASLQCVDCHSENGRMDWRALGYDGDPAFVGGRSHRRLLAEGDGGVK